METSSFTLAKSSVRKRQSWVGEVNAVFVKDLRSELRTKAALGSILVFAITTLLLLSLLIDTTGPGLTIWLGETGPEVMKLETRARLLSCLLWVILYFSAMAGLPRVFVKEEEMRTAAALRLTAQPSAVYAGKLLFNLVLILSISVLLMPLFTLLFDPDIANWPLFVANVVLGSAGMAGGATLLGAMVARTSNRGYVMIVLGFGPLLPILLLSIKGTTAAIYGRAGNNLLELLSYLVAITILSAGLFEKVWKD